MKLVNVLMSTYNGEHYLEEQLNSIFSQEYQNFTLYVRDDGSTDKTVKILKQYRESLSDSEKMVIMEGENVGVIGSFLTLLNKSKEADYYALCDQDDVWFSDKIKIAVDQLQAVEKYKGCDEPALYCCRTSLTDEDLNPAEDSLRTYHPRPAFGNAMIENICTGCTIVINRALYNIIKDKYPKNYLIHDMWLYQVAACYGTVIYDNEPHIYYRQHAGNVIGLDNGRWSLIKRQISSFGRFRGKYTAQIEEFIDMFRLKGENEYLAKLITGTRNSWKCRFKVLFDKRIYRQGIFDNIIFKGMLFFGLL